MSILHSLHVWQALGFVSAREQCFGGPFESIVYIINIQPIASRTFVLKMGISEFTFAVSHIPRMASHLLAQFFL